MSTSYTMRPSVRAKLRAFLVHQNPFYLLSALCMLAGCYALNSGLGVRTGELPKLLGLIGALNAYEALLIALGLYLIRRRRILRDGRTLLLLQSAFLADIAFLNAQAGSVSFRTGMLVSAAVIALTVLKVGIVIRILWGRLPLKLTASVLLGLAALQTMPTVFAWLDHHGGVHWQQCYAWWWVAGALVGALGLTKVPFDGEADPLRRVLRLIYLGLPLASLVAHLAMLHWVYRVPFTASDLSPLLLGTGVLMARSRLRRELWSPRVLATLAALVLAMHDNHRLILHDFDFTAFQLTLAATYTAIAFCSFRRWFAPLIAAGAGLVSLVLFGPSFEQICLVVADGYRRVVSFLGALVPKTAIEWGVTAVTASFAFLAIGAAVSLKKGGLPEIAAEGTK